MKVVEDNKGETQVDLWFTSGFLDDTKGMIHERNNW